MLALHPHRYPHLTLYLPLNLLLLCSNPVPNLCRAVSPKGVGLDPRQNRSGWKQAFSASVGAVALPHPHKMPNGALSANQREHRHMEIAEDSSLSEDAYFVLDCTWPTPTTDTVHYIGLADGVGSWRKLGVDPREFR